VRLEIRGLEKLSFRERQVVALKETGKSAEEIARRLGIGVSTVATLFNRARTKGYEVVLVVPDAQWGMGEEWEADENEETNAD